ADHQAAVIDLVWDEISDRRADVYERGARAGGHWAGGLAEARVCAPIKPGEGWKAVWCHHAIEGGAGEGDAGSRQRGRKSEPADTKSHGGEGGIAQSVIHFKRKAGVWVAESIRRRRKDHAMAGIAHERIRSQNGIPSP